MKFDSDQIAAIIGSKELELIGLRMEVARLSAELKALQPNEKPKLEAVE